MKPIFSAQDIPFYHERLLLVRMGAEAAIRFAGHPDFAMGGRGDEAPGLSRLACFDRGGLIRRVSPVAHGKGHREPPSEPGARAISAIGSTFAGPVRPVAPTKRAGTHAASGVSMIELERAHDLAELQRALADDPNIEFVSRIPRRYIFVRDGGPSAPAMAPSRLWNLEKIGWSRARSIPGLKDAESVKVAILDTGIDRQHPDLKGMVGKYCHGWPDLDRASDPADIVGHGTHVAGTISARIDNRIGINGVCQADLRIWKIFDDVADFTGFGNGYLYFVDPMIYLRSLADCIEEKVDIVNLSIGGPGVPDKFELSLFEELMAGGTTIVAAMGNQRDEGSPISYPAAIPGVIAVGATKVDDRIASFSNRGNHITISAPGAGIWSTLPTTPGQFGFRAEKGSEGTPREGRPVRRETDYDSWDGTSMATAHVTGAIALLLANRGQMSPQDVRSHLSRSAAKVHAMKRRPFHPDFGYGRLDLFRLLTG